MFIQDMEKKVAETDRIFFEVPEDQKKQAFMNWVEAVMNLRKMETQKF